MSFTLEILRSARKKLDKMDNNLARKIYAHIENLMEDPYRPRPGMDIVRSKAIKDLLHTACE